MGVAAMGRIDVLLMGLFIASLMISGCTNTTSSTPASQPAQPSAFNGTFAKVEVYHFHGTNQCTSCIAVGNLAEKTVNDNFKPELASGRVVFAHINYDLPENVALAKKYSVTGSSLWIGVYDANGFHQKEDTRVWSLIGNKDAYNFYLTSLISKRLNGDLS